MLTVPLAEARAEHQVSNSRFIGCLAPVASAEEGRHFIQQIKQEFPDASHHVPAFIIGGGNSSSEFCSDDGEPSGTSGRPVLAVLKGSGLGNVVLVVVRYFGGTKLGTGGLVKAYTEAAQRVLAQTQRARLVPSHTVNLELPYHLYERCRQECDTGGAQIIKEAFTASVQIRLQIACDGFDAFCAQIAEMSAGGIHPEIIETSDRRLPL
ncbi:MAG: YigZ family protein [Spirochaetes bacterium]|nr:YigZ family protein [Spirochaetota bacterium]MBU0955655.1 YigZ family protein [Spirochaetota bacterium]